MFRLLFAVVMIVIMLSQAVFANCPDSSDIEITMSDPEWNNISGYFEFDLTIEVDDNCDKCVRYADCYIPYLDANNNQQRKAGYLFRVDGDPSCVAGSYDGYARPPQGWWGTGIPWKIRVEVQCCTGLLGEVIKVETKNVTLNQTVITGDLDHRFLLPQEGQEVESGKYVHLEHYPMFNYGVGTYLLQPYVADTWSHIYDSNYRHPYDKWFPDLGHPDAYKQFKLPIGTYTTSGDRDFFLEDCSEGYNTGDDREVYSKSSVWFRYPEPLPSGYPTLCGAGHDNEQFERHDWSVVDP